jgi:hypothetical protein
MRQEPRLNNMLSDILRVIHPAMAQEQVAVLSRALARIVHNNPQQRRALGEVSRKAFADETYFLGTRQTSGFKSRSM